jgi:regulator of sigma E protease
MAHFDSILSVARFLLSGALQLFVVLFFFGFCIFFHELGHLLAAIWCKLHVERFAVGFGRPIWKRRWRGVEYQLGWIPFGGFVALPQLEPGNTPKTSEGQPLPLVSPKARIITAFAGPFFNIILGMALAMLLWGVGVKGFPYESSIIVDYVLPTYVGNDGKEHPTPEASVAGLLPGDKILKINDETFSRGWEEAMQLFVFAKNGRIKLEVERDGQVMTLPEYTMAPNKRTFGLGFPFIDPVFPTAVGSVVPDSPAERAGLQPGDQFMAVNGMPLRSNRHFTELVRGYGNRPLSLTILRDGKELVIDGVQPELKAQSYEIDDKETGQKIIQSEVSYVIGVSIDNRVLVYPDPIGFFNSTVAMTYRTLRSLPDKGNLIGPKHLSGPLGIFASLLMFFHDGFRSGLKFVALLSFCLALTNLLPLPVLDGGHITMGFIEMIFRRRIPAVITVGLSYLFAGLIIAMALYITLYDGQRIYHQVMPERDTPPAQIADPVDEPPTSPAAPVVAPTPGSTPATP